MPRGYQYDATWQQEPLLRWVARGRSNEEAFCSYCQCYINIRIDGMEALLVHSDLESHQFIMNYKIDGRISSRDHSLASTARTDLTQRAEILWCLQVASAGYPYHTANNTDLFSAMFVDSKIAKNVVVGRSKMKYEINKGINPYLLEQVVKPVTENNSYYVLHYEECITEARKRTLDIYARFWHDYGGKVANVLIGSYPIKRYDSGVTLAKCLDAIEKAKLPLKHLVYVTCHETAGDLQVYRGLEREITDHGGVPMIEMLPFNESVIYTAYGKLLHVVAEWGLEDLVYDLRLWFNTCTEPDQPFVSLVEVFANENLGHTNERFASSSQVNDTTPKSCYRINDALLYRHTLGLSSSFADILANWPCLVKYFQNYVPSTERGIKKVPRYQRLQAAFSNPLTLLRVTFLRSVGRALEDFLDCSLGCEGPSIHLLSTAVSRLIKDIGGRFLKAEPRADAISGIAHIKFEERDEQLSNERLNIGAGPGTFREVPIHKLTVFYAEVRTAYAVIFGYMLTHLPITDPVVRGSRALNPLHRTDKDLYTAMKQLVKSVAQVVHPPTVNKVLDEWDLYQTSELEDVQVNESVEEYWDRIFKITALGGVHKFGMMAKLVQVMLCVHYRPRNEERLLRSVEHRRATKIAHEFVTLQCAGKVSDASITDGLIAAYQTGWAKYSAHYSNKGFARQASNALGSGGILGDGVNALAGADITKAGYHGIREAEFLCSEGVRRITQGLDRDNFLEINGGMALIEEARSKIRVTRAKLTHREYIRELDNNNRLLAIGLYRIRQSKKSAKEAEARDGLEVIKRGLEGISDLRMDLRPESGGTHTAE